MMRTCPSKFPNLESAKTRAFSLVSASRNALPTVVPQESKLLTSDRNIINQILLNDNTNESVLDKGAPARFPLPSNLSSSLP